MIKKFLLLSEIAYLLLNATHVSAQPSDFVCRSKTGAVIQYQYPISATVWSGNTYITSVAVRVQRDPNQLITQLLYSEYGNTLTLDLRKSPAVFHLVSGAVHIDETVQCTPPEGTPAPSCHWVCRTNGEGRDYCRTQCN